MKIKNLNIKRRLISLALAASLSFSLGAFSVSNAQDIDSKKVYSSIKSNFMNKGVYKFNDEYDMVINNNSVELVKSNNLDELEYNSEFNIYELGGTIKTTSNLNFRTGPTTKYKVIKTLKKGTEAEVIGITDNNWFIVKVDDTIGCLSGDYVSYTPAEEKTSKGDIIHKFVYATSSVNFRTEASTESDKIDTLDKGTKLEYLDYLDDGWYLVRYNGKVGYVSGEFTDFKDPIHNYRNDFIKVVYVTKAIGLKEEPNDESTVLYDMSKTEACEVLSEEGDWYKVRCNNQIGYISKQSTEELTGIFIVVDISDQTLTLYDGNVILLEVEITSGTEGVYDTPYGLFSIQSKARKTYLRGPGYRSYVEYWMPFYLGYGLHDANWRKVFGKNYYKTSGSHGCVNVPPENTGEIYDTVEVGTKVLVHK